MNASSPWESAARQSSGATDSIAASTLAASMPPQHCLAKYKQYKDKQM
jgi:hypothetical protein